MSWLLMKTGVHTSFELWFGHELLLYPPVDIELANSLAALEEALEKVGRCGRSVLVSVHHASPSTPLPLWFL